MTTTIIIPAVSYGMLRSSVIFTNASQPFQNIVNIASHTTEGCEPGFMQVEIETYDNMGHLFLLGVAHGTIIANDYDMQQKIESSIND